jgi:hypothetical protein
MTNMKEEPLKSAPSGTTTLATPTASSPSATEQTITYPLRIRGTLTQLSPEHDYEFRAQRSTGVSSQDILKETATGKLYRTLGEKKPKIVVHASVNASSPDPAADLLEQVEKLSAPLKPKALKPMRGRVLLDEPHLRIAWSKTRRTIELTLSINIDETPNYQNQLIKLMQQSSSCLAINQTSLAPRKS